MIKEIRINKKIVAILIRYKTYKKLKGINFFTKEKYPLQVACMHHNKNHVIHPHVHKNIIRKIKFTSEVLIIQSGEVLVNLLNNSIKFT